MRTPAALGEGNPISRFLGLSKRRARLAITVLSSPHGKASHKSWRRSATWPSTAFDDAPDHGARPPAPQAFGRARCPSQASPLSRQLNLIAKRAPHIWLFFWPLSRNGEEENEEKAVGHPAAAPRQNHPCQLHPGPGLSKAGLMTEVGSTVDP